MPLLIAEIDRIKVVEFHIATKACANAANSALGTVCSACLTSARAPRCPVIMSPCGYCITTHDHPHLRIRRSLVFQPPEPSVYTVVLSMVRAGTAPSW